MPPRGKVTAFKPMESFEVIAPVAKGVDTSIVPPDEKPWNVADLMREWLISRPYVYYLIKQEGLPHDFFGGRYQFYPTLLHEWRLKRQKVI